jgi:hypothetical protein
VVGGEPGVESSGDAYGEPGSEASGDAGGEGTGEPSGETKGNRGPVAAICICNG